MKKFLLTLLAGAASMSMAAADVNIVFADLDEAAFTGTRVETTYNDDGSVKQYGRYQPIEEIVAEGYTLTFETNGVNNEPAVYDTKAANHISLRMYYAKGNATTPAAGNIMTVEGPAFKSIVMTFEGASYVGNMTASVGTVTIDSTNKQLIWSNTEAVDGVSFEVAEKSVRFTGMTISADAAQEPTLPEGVVAMFLKEADSEATALAGWTLEDNTFTKGDSEGYVWSWKVYNGLGYLNASAFVSSVKYASKAYAVSPVIDLTNVENASAEFDHAAKFQTNLTTDCKFVVREEGATAWTEVAIPTWPVAGGWNFVNSGSLDLKAFDGKKVQVAFLYVSTTDAADTWEVRNLNIKGDKNSGISSIEADAAEAVYYNLQGVRVAEPQSGIYVKVQGGKATKVAF